MSPASDISIAATALRDVFFSVDPWLAALWFLSAIALGGLLVYAWRRDREPAGLCANAMRRCYG
jgi:hypothetical protein